MPDRSVVLYVGGYGRSGSTLLDLVLSRHPRVVGAGEMNRLFDSAMQGRLCSCGQTVAACPLWSGALDHLATQMPDFPPDEAHRLTRSLERTRRFPGWLFGSRFRQRGQVYGRIWRTMLEYVRRETGATVVVDSSKTNHLSMFRPLALSRLAGADVRSVQLIRDVRGVIWSFRRGSNERLESGADPGFRGGAIRPVVGWIAANSAVHLVDALRGVKSLRVRYEDFARDPEGWAEQVYRMLELEMAEIRKGTPIGGVRTDHGIAGNRLRRRGVDEIQLDEQWKEALSGGDRWTARLAWFLQRLYGY